MKHLAKNMLIFGELLIVLFLFVSNVYAFDPDLECATTGQTSNQPFIPTTGTIRVPVIFVRFDDVVFSPPGCHQDPQEGWPDNLFALPAWADDFIDASANPPYTSGGLSDFFYQMSDGQYNFIGDIYFFKTEESFDYWESQGRGDLNKHIINEFDSTIDYSDYDSDGDGVVDLIVFMYRFWNSTFAGFNGVGIANLGFSGSVFHDGKEIKGGFPGSGISQHNATNLGFARQVAAHEVTHYFFGGNHFDFTGAWAMHDGHSHVAFNGYERLLLNWITPTVIDSDTPDLVITDAITTSDYYRININSNEYFLLENRQQLSIHEQAPFCAGGIPGTGLMIAHIMPNASLKRDRVKWEAADGSFSINDGGDPTDTYKPGNKTEFAPYTTPNTNANDGSFTDIGILNIREQNNDIIVDITMNAPPGPPQNLVITNAGQDGQNVVLTWDANTEPDLDHYAIYRGYQDDRFSAVNWLSNPVATTNATTWTDPFVKINTSASSSVHYRITAVDDVSNESDYSNSVSTNSYQVPKFGAPKLPEVIALHQNYPNPFNPVTEINFDLPEAAQVVLKIYNVLGEEVRTLVDDQIEIGFHSVSWDGKDEAGKDLPSGVYLYRFSANSRNMNDNSFVAVKKLTLLR